MDYALALSAPAWRNYCLRGLNLWVSRRAPSHPSAEESSPLLQLRLGPRFAGGGVGHELLVKVTEYAMVVVVVVAKRVRSKMGRMTMMMMMMADDGAILAVMKIKVLQAMMIS